MNKTDIPQFINKQSVEMLLQSNRVTAKRVSLDLGWGADALGKYMRYEDKIPKERRIELAKYFNINHPSKLANQQPTKAIRAAYERYSDHRIEQYELKKQEETKDAVTVDKHEWETVKTLLINFANSNNTTIQRVEGLDNRFDNLDERISDLMNYFKKAEEKADTRQGYNVKLIKDLSQEVIQLKQEVSQLKLAARYNRQRCAK